MKKTLSIIAFLFLAIHAFCFDFNKDNFSVELDIETALFVYKDKIYILDGDGKLWASDRPKKIVNEFGYPVLNITESQYYENFTRKPRGMFLLDLNGDIFPVYFFDNNHNSKDEIALFKKDYGAIISIKASSELTETLKNKKTVYSALCSFFRAKIALNTVRTNG